MSATADALVVFGITGDLARTKTLPALYAKPCLPHMAT